MVETRLILASTSRYRAALLGRLGFPFDAQAPEVDETPITDESPADTAARLSREKASAVAARHTDAWVIGSDQLAERNGQPLGKPGDRAHAIEQLASMAGQVIAFHTAVCLVRGGHVAGLHLDRTLVCFRALSRGEIQRYVDAERPFDCAGSFKSEGLGITLFDRIESTDPTALIGLPLIGTARLLRDVGFALP